MIMLTADRLTQLHELLAEEVENPRTYKVEGQVIKLRVLLDLCQLFDDNEFEPTEQQIDGFFNDVFSYEGETK